MTGVRHYRCHFDFGAGLLLLFDGLACGMLRIEAREGTCLDIRMLCLDMGIKV